MDVPQRFKDDLFVLHLCREFGGVEVPPGEADEPGALDEAFAEVRAERRARRKARKAHEARRGRRSPRLDSVRLRLLRALSARFPEMGRPASEGQGDLTTRGNREAPA